MTMTAATLCYFWLRRTTDWNRQPAIRRHAGRAERHDHPGRRDGRRGAAIALAHALRILTVVMTIPIWYRLVNGAQTSVLTMVHGPTGNDWKDYAC